jgi:Transglycosylase SLT domain
MNKVNLILLIIAMFTGFPAIVAVSQNITVTTPSEAYFPESSSSVVQTKSSSSILSSSQLSSSSLEIYSSLSVSSSSIVSSSQEKPKVTVVEAPPLMVVKSISSASKMVQDIKKPEPTKIVPKAESKPIVKAEIKQEVKTETKIENSISSTLPEVKPEPKVIISSSSKSIQSTSDTPKPKTNLSFAEQITARCEILGCNATQLIRVMKCESSGNPTVVGSGLYIGLFQFLPSTFNAYKVKAGLPNGDIYNGSDQIHVATYMFANGQARQWGCK